MLVLCGSDANLFFFLDLFQGRERAEQFVDASRKGMGRRMCFPESVQEEKKKKKRERGKHEG